MSSVWSMGFDLPVVGNNEDPSAASERHAVNRGPHQRLLLLVDIQLLIFVAFNVESRVLRPP
ncbi:MAG: hypothetical protein GY917_15735 [Planctomycetaceae bacterium]|nr:hypothetical protein [Planctomycetaceae bacterium]